MKFISFVRDPDNVDHEITVDYETDWFWKLFGYQTIRKTYVGSHTVWYDKETGRRVGTMTESRLSDMFEFQERKVRQAKKNQRSS